MLANLESIQEIANKDRHDRQTHSQEKWKAKAQLKLKLPSDTKSNKKKFCQFAHRKRFRAKSSEEMWHC